MCAITYMNSIVLVEDHLHLIGIGIMSTIWVIIIFVTVNDSICWHTIYYIYIYEHICTSFSLVISSFHTFY